MAVAAMGTGSVAEDGGDDFDSPDLDLRGITTGWQAWPAHAAAEAPLLPYWEEAGEQPEHQGTVYGFHTEPCTDFQNGYCSYHRPKGKASACFCYHFESQHRRPPVDAAMGRLLYWDVPCHSMSTDSACPSGDACVFAHSREEISYHPAKYKTRRCNGRGCRGEAICCFAHSEAELRVWAPERYSYWTLVSGRPQGPLTSVGSADWPTTLAASSGSDDWRRPLFGRTQLPTTRHKQRFCASFPDVSQCRRGAACAFAHSREEARTPLLTLEQEQQAPSALTEEFFMYKFKTLWCPIGVQHDWQTCVYAHNYQDARRQVSIGYGPRPCPYWAKKDPSAEYSQRCPLGLRCPFSHGAKEQLYHPQYFRTVICRDLRAKACPRQRLCAFFHRRAERRKPPTDSTDYSVPLKEEALPESWVADFLSPPFRDAAPPPGAVDGADGGVGAMATAGMSRMDGAGAYWCATYGLGGAMLEASEDRQGRHSEDSSRLAGIAKHDETYQDFMLRLSMLPPKEEAEGEGTPRTQSGESNGDDSSTSTSREVHRVRAGGRAPGAGVVKSGTVLTPLDDRDPWKVQAPSYGPFGGPFDAFPGFLANANEATSSSWWGAPEGEPRMVAPACQALHVQVL